jgi:tetratricopeptide (TPR) repeat protein
MAALSWTALARAQAPAAPPSGQAGKPAANGGEKASAAPSGKGSVAAAKPDANPPRPMAAPAGSAEASADANPLAAARAHFQKGVEYYGASDFPAALVEFERAYVLQPAFRLLYNLGQVNYELHDYASAERHFKAYLADGGAEIAAARRAEVEEELRRLRSRIASVELICDVPGARLFIDDRPVGQAPLGRIVRVNAGQRQISAERKGYPTVSKQVDVLGGDRMRVELNFSAPALAAAASASSASAQSWALWTGVATGVFALGAAGMGLWVAADADRYDNELRQLTSRGALDSLADQTKRKALVADILLGATAVSGAITLILLFADRSSERPKPSAAAAPADGLSFDARRLQLQF